jgi:hypothetical protein
MAGRIAYYGNIVTNGLIVNFDAAKKDSYQGSGTIWRDISGNGNSGTLVNEPVFNSTNGGYMSFDGVNDYITTSYTQPAQNTTTSFSWNSWVYPVRNSNADIFMGNRKTTLNFIKLTSNNFEYYPMSFGGALALNIWQNICVVKSGSNFTYYKNGSQTATSTSTGSLVANPFFIGGDNTASEYGQGRVAVAQIYNKALLAFEVLQNFNALKSRFGL